MVKGAGKVYRWSVVVVVFEMEYKIGISLICLLATDVRHILRMWCAETVAEKAERGCGKVL